MSKRLDDIAARVEAATPGPWTWEREDDSMDILSGPNPEHFVLATTKCKSCVGGPNRCFKQTGEDARFISRARADVPYLLAIARAAERVFRKWDEGSDDLDAEIDALRAALESETP